MSDNWLLYDGECPFCRNYTELYKIRQAAGTMRLVNAREKGPEYDLVKTAGYNIDEGMALSYEGKLYHGTDAAIKLAELGADEGIFNKVNNKAFQNKTVAKYLYPAFKCGRAVVLKALGRSKIG